MTALGTRLFGQYGDGAGRNKAEVNQVKKAADEAEAKRKAAEQEKLRKQEEAQRAKDEFLN